MTNNIIYQNDKIIVRLQERKDGTFITVHELQDGLEQRPRGYMLGSNCLLYEPRK